MMKKTLTMLQFIKMIFKAIASVAIALNIIGVSAAYSQNMQTDISNLLDGPAGQTSVQRDSKEEFSYEDVLRLWKSIDDINDWIVKNFSYDTTRAMKLALNQEESRPAVFSPAETFLKKSGVCIDLARFTFETVRAIRPELEVKYLLIEFEPIVVGNSTFKKHWVVAFRESTGIFIFADTKRPGVTLGPYRDIQEYINEYQAYRQRKIYSYKLLESFQKRLKIKKLHSL